jgi:hypothetical protein
MKKIEKIEPLDLSKIKETDLSTIHNSRYKYHQIDKLLKIECQKCSNIFYQDIYFHIQGGGCLMCSLQNLISVLNPE